MKTINSKILLALACTLLPASAALNVVATLPDYGAIAQAIGGTHVKVTSMARGTEDPHFVDAKPSFVKILNRADVLLEGGVELEIGWLPPLVNAARNAKILSDAPGHVILSRGISLLDVPTGPVDRSMGDVHPLGNPHYWLDPANGRILAGTIAAALSQVDPMNAAEYASNLVKFNQQLEEKLTEWTRRLEPYRGTKVITYHKSYDYLLKHFGFELVDTIEPKPGIEPSPSHINALIPHARQSGVKLILIEPCRPHKTPDFVARTLGVKLLVVPGQVGGDPKIRDYFELFDFIVAELADALKT